MELLSPPSCPGCLVNPSSQAPWVSKWLMHQKRADGLIHLLTRPGDWKSIHLDDLMPPENFQANLGQLSKMTIAEIFTSSSLQHLPTGKKSLTINPPSPHCCPLQKPTAPSLDVPPVDRPHSSAKWLVKRGRSGWIHHCKPTPGGSLNPRSSFKVSSQLLPKPEGLVSPRS